jgi:hypothetical protein
VDATAVPDLQSHINRDSSVATTATVHDIENQLAHDLAVVEAEEGVGSQRSIMKKPLVLTTDWNITLRVVGYAGAIGKIVLLISRSTWS